MHPVLIQIGSLKVHSYGFFVALGILVATFLTMKRFREDPQVVLDLALVVVFFGVVGARLGYVFLYDTDYYLSNPWRILMLNQGGLTFYGALIGGILSSLIFVWRKKISFFHLADCAAPYLALGYAIARIGCFLNGCCYGQPTDLPWGVVFPVVDNLSRHPTQLYSSAANLLNYGILEYLLSRHRFPGQVFSTYLILYGLSRGVIELLREHVGLTGGIPVAVIAALAIATAGCLFYLFLGHRKKKAAFPR